MKNRIVRLLLLLVAGNAGAWLLAFAAFGQRPALLGTALLAYTFGLRHAVDADHISAIDNVTRNLLHRGKKPLTVGLWFSLGHATIVVALSAAIALGAGAIRANLPQLASFGGVIGTGVSAFFLFVVAFLNVGVLLNVVRAWRARRSADGTDVPQPPSSGGLIGRFAGPCIRAVDSSVKMYPLGVLFGLGFDTATEIGLLGIAALEAGHGTPPVAIMIFPLLFAAGMCLIDTADGMLMLGAYGWALVKPSAKFAYNAAVTAISVGVALTIGTIEVAGIIGDRAALHGPLWDACARIGDHFGAIGAAVIVLFAVMWATAALRERRVAVAAAE